MNDKPKVVPFPDGAEPIAKPGEFNLDDFKSKASGAAKIDTLQTALPVHSIAQAKDFVRLHPDEQHYWSAELCFVHVPIKGQKRDTIHLINEELADSHLIEVRYGRLALASKPFSVFFLALIPTRNLDNSYNASNLLGCEQAKLAWVKLKSLRDENAEGYQVIRARDPDAFTVKWPTQSLDALIQIAYAGLWIRDGAHPAMARLIGAKQQLG